MTAPKIYHVCVECSPVHVDNCETCFGWGLKKGTNAPITAGALDVLQECDPCPECGGDLMNVHLYKLEKEAVSLSVESLKKIKIEAETAPGEWNENTTKIFGTYIDAHSVQTSTQNLDGTFTHTWTIK